MANQFLKNSKAIVQHKHAVKDKKNSTDQTHCQGASQVPKHKMPPKFPLQQFHRQCFENKNDNFYEDYTSHHRTNGSFDSKFNINISQNINTGNDCVVTNTNIGHVDVVNGSVPTGEQTG